MVPRIPSPAPPPLVRPRLAPRDASADSYKPSLHPYSQSNFADDERTPSENSSMGPNQTNRVEARRYEDEDIRTTSQQELRGFYMYGWAAEVNLQYTVGATKTILTKCDRSS
jgi:UMF1 family MFS transporter